MIILLYFLLHYVILVIVIKATIASCQLDHVILLKILRIPSCFLIICQLFPYLFLLFSLYVSFGVCNVYNISLSKRKIIKKEIPAISVIHCEKTMRHICIYPRCGSVKNIKDKILRMIFILT